MTALIIRLLIDRAHRSEMRLTYRTIFGDPGRKSWTRLSSRKTFEMSAFDTSLSAAAVRPRQSGTSLRGRCLTLAAASVASVVAACGSTSAAGDDSTTFFRNKTIEMAIGFDVGGGYDLYARLIARYMGKHIPGNPLIIPQNMPGAGSRVAANWLYNVAPKDGTAIGMIDQSSPLDQAMGEPGIQFELCTVQLARQSDHR